MKGLQLRLNCFLSILGLIHMVLGDFEYDVADFPIFDAMIQIVYGSFISAVSLEWST